VAKENIKRASLDEINRMHEEGLLHHSPNAPVGAPPEYAHVENDDFWENAKVEFRGGPPRSVHLKLDPDVFDYFKSLGKGHITKMQEVLRAYANAHRR
jgi:uncharacterized protein (DUF4415 family)